MLVIERHILCVFTLFLGLGLFAQTDERDIIERSIEIIAENAEDENLDYTNLVDELTGFLERPLDLNKADFELLSSVRLLSDIQVLAILEHRRIYGAFISFEELQSIPALDIQTLRVIRPFVKVRSGLDDLRIKPKEIWENSTNELYIRSDRTWEERKGYSPATDAELADNPNARYLGSPIRLYTRYRFSYQNKISIGFTGEKDGGEEFFKGSQKQGFDFYSAHAYFSGLGKIDKLAIGDFHAIMGQGLVLWTGLGFGKSMDLLTLKRNAKGVTPYRSVDENRFLRGGAITLKQDRWRLTMLYSSHGRDGNILTGDTLSAEESTSFSALQTSGFHRMPNEIADKNKITENVMAGELSWRKRGIQIGVRGMHFKYSKELDKNTQVSSQYTFQGKEGGAIGLDYDYVKSNLNVFGEIARSENGALAFLNGAYLVMDPKLTFAAFYRHFDRDYQNPFALAVAESSFPVNEQGLLMGFMSRPARKWEFSAWMDRFQFPWLRYQTDAPSQGWEVMTQLTYKPDKTSEYYIRYRKRERPKNSAEDAIVDYVSQTMQQNLRLNMKYPLTESWSMRSRIEWTEYVREGNKTQQGLLLYQDVIFRPKSSPFDLTFRYALFDTDGYDARLYAYESDVLYFYSIPALSGRGSRYYIVGRYTVRKGVDIWVKWARWHYLNQDQLSSGLDAIDGPIKSDIRVQLRLKF
jgi:hypothetical protein